MTGTTTTHDPKALELQARSLEALVSLLHALNASSDVADVSKRALLTVSGQLLVTRVALFIHAEGVFSLRAAVGLPVARIEPVTWPLPDRFERAFAQSADGVVEIDGEASEIEARLAVDFDRAARLTNGEDTVGVLLLGGWLGSRALGDADGQLLRTMGVVIGTTLHRVFVQEELERARKRLEDVQRMRQGVMDHVSHEFNTPLMVVKSVGGLLRTAKPEEADGLLDMHDESVVRLEKLVESIIAAGQEANRVDARVKIPVAKFVDEVLRPWAMRKTEPLARIDYGTAGQDRVDVDETLVEIVLDALYRNAVEASVDERSPVWVNVYAIPSGWWEQHDFECRLTHYESAERIVRDDAVELGVDRPDLVSSPDRELVIEIVDVGCGIAEDEMEHIFDAFFLASNSARHRVAGAGMGLTAARRVAEEMGGQLLLKSRLDRGTVAALILPIHAGNR